MVNVVTLGLLALSTVCAPVVAQYIGGDTSGCGKTHWFNGITQYRTVKSSGQDRSYGVHLPSNYSESHKYPTIIGFHGSSSIGLFFEVDTSLDDAKYTGDKIMVYPNGVGGAWAGANYSKATVGQDLQFVWDMLGDLRRNFCIDSARIYATGLSNGGGFVDTIACNATVGGEFAAFAPASGSFYTNNNANHGDCKPARVPTPILEFHGGADADVKYAGGEGEGGIEPSIPDWLGWWAERNQCDQPNVQEDLFSGDVHHLSWTCKGQKGVLQHYKTDSQKHDWPSTEINFSQLAAGDKPTHIEASALIQDFFMKYTRPAA
ncbi:putative feruloyl esterase C-like protein [Cladobotryum mycophilum]|uniref:feruloyl esterase n=1 Tax=Cladobotryum mycophilum TaxID=491253 RepID=A0ABR0SKE6_9HYPO